jgi:hypothetical protein
MQYYGGPPNGVFDTQNTIAQLKCKLDDLQQTVNKISPRSVPISRASFTNNITLPIPASQITWLDPVTSNTHSLQQALQTTNTRISSLNLDQDLDQAPVVYLYHSLPQRLIV